MTREQRDMAIAIARDVLEQLKAENGYKITRGVYFEPSGLSRYVSGDLKDHLDVVVPDCQVCMLGAVMISKAKLYDNVPMKNIARHSREAICGTLCDVFDQETLDCLEAAFEMSVANATEETDMVRGSAIFGYGFYTASERAEAVAQNIIDNDGLFIVDPVFEEDYMDSDCNNDSDDSDDSDDDDGEWEDEE